MKDTYGSKLSGTIFHSDRGSQYTSEAFKEALADSGMLQSLSGTGHCFDNARMESFFATLKKEKIYRIAAYKLTREEVKTMPRFNSSNKNLLFRKKQRSRFTRSR